MKAKQMYIGLTLIICVVSLSSCAPKGYDSNEAGFISGLWHGFIIVFSLLGKLIGADIGIYAENNSGFFYWLGFIIGIGGFGGGSASRR